MRLSNLCLSESATSILLFLLLRVLSWSESELQEDELEECLERLLDNNNNYMDCLSLTADITSCASL